LMRRTLPRAVLLCALSAAAFAAGAAKMPSDEVRSDGYDALNSEAQALMGELKYQKGDDSGAKRSYRKAVVNASKDGRGGDVAALTHLRAAADAGNDDQALGEAYDFLRRYPDRPERSEAGLAAGALHLRRGEPERALKFLAPLAQGREPPLRSRAIHLLGGAL